MRAVLLDTNVWSWALLRSKKLSSAAREANDAADTRYVSPASFYEIAQKVRLGKWPEIAAFVPHLLGFAEAQGLDIANLGGEICLKAGTMDWSHRATPSTGFSPPPRCTTACRSFRRTRFSTGSSAGSGELALPCGRESSTLRSIVGVEIARNSGECFDLQIDGKRGLK